MIRLFDLLISFILLCILTPFYIIISIIVVIESKGGILYKQKRVGLNEKEFYLLKFRTMRINSDKKSLLTIGKRDARITRNGYILRKYKLDELPQLLNVLKGDMSLVGPRPEVEKFVSFYNKEQKKVLKIKPGITDYASIKFINENEILGNSENPEKTYIEEIMPLKLALNMKYINNYNVKEYLKIILLTIFKIFR